MQTPTENQASYLIVLKRKRSLSQKLFTSYWKDVHGPMIASIPNLLGYRQIHLQEDLGGIWPPMPGVSVGGADQMIDGIAELTFESIEKMDSYSKLEPAVLGTDDTNFLDGAGKYFVASGNRTVLVDRSAGNVHNGDNGTFGLVTVLKRSDGISLQDFRIACRKLADDFSRWSGIIMVGLTLPDINATTDKALDVDGNAEHPFQAALELVFANRLDQRLCFDEVLSSKSAAFSQAVSQINVYPISGWFTFVQNSTPTLLGEHGASTADVLVKVGATNVVKAKHRRQWQSPTGLETE